MAKNDINDLAAKWFKSGVEGMAAREQAILDAVHSRTAIARPPSGLVGDERTTGEKMADKVAAFGGSWTFIMLFAAFLVLWVLVNSWILRSAAFDAYPYIFLNLILSMVAALQAPIIMMSQNRQAKKDRQTAEDDYGVNLKAEIEIMGLHEKLDEMRAEQMTRLLTYQQEQIEMLTQLLQHGRS
jgi:uncharacterized membrane protein